jgi:transketolase
MSSRQQLANAIRVLAMDAVQKANSGHPGMPMGMADIAEVLWNDFLNHNPSNPQWANRDRFILSNGHGSMLQYALLHLTGYDLSIEDLKAFRQLHSKTPGHPEYAETPGVETTTGPLGQGLANGVGMALAEKLLATEFNRPGLELIDHHTYVFLGDGCLMEGISHEACSLAGTWGLGKLIAFYDDNNISIDGHVDGWFSENIPERFNAYQWHVVPNVDGHDPEAIKKAIIEAKNTTDKPSLICCKTTIGYGAPNLAGTENCHGAPLGDKEIEATRAALNWSYPSFEIPYSIYQSWDARNAGQRKEAAWNEKFQQYQSQHPEQAQTLLRRLKGQLPENWSSTVQSFLENVVEKKATTATRKASQEALNAYAPALPELLGGSADLTGSNNTDWKGCKSISPQDFSGNYIHYGVREFAMSAIMTGIALHGGFIPYGGTFLVFSDYARNAVRLAALMKQRVIYVYSHDSIGLGEDGPTHQPIEHAAMLRMTPNLNVWRPADTLETAVAWQMAIERQEGPSTLLLSRQNLNYCTERNDKDIVSIRRGAYILFENKPDILPDIIFIATGSEVSIALEAAHRLDKDNKSVRVVSMPCAELFKQQPADYQHHLLPPKVHARIAIEAGVSDFWYQYVGLSGKIIGIDRFGLSAPASDIYQDFNLNAETAYQMASTLIHQQCTFQEKEVCL